MLHAGSMTFHGHKVIWKTWAPLEIKIFLWLAFRRRHWTGDRRLRHRLEAVRSAILYDQGRETIDHILAECPITREIWFHILSAFGQHCPPAAASSQRWWRRLRSLFTVEKRKGIDSLFVLVSWEIWKERNTRCFREFVFSIIDFLQVVRAEADRWIEAGANGLRALAQPWVWCLAPP